LWNIYNLWENKDISKERLLELSRKINIRPDIIERLIALYDTSYQIMKADIQQIYIGGSMINQVYIDPSEARLSIHIHTAIREGIKSKNELIDVFINLRERMIKDKSIISLNIGDLEVYIGEIISDTKRQSLHPKVLFLNRSIPSFFIGTPLPNYLNKLGFTTNNTDVNKFLMRIKRELGYMPKIYNIRIEIRFDKDGINYPYIKRRVYPYFKDDLIPTKVFTCNIEEVSSAAKGKIEFLEIVDKYQTINIINTICDLRILYLYDLKIKISEDIINKIEKIKDRCQEDFEKYWFYKLISTKYSFYDIFRAIMK